MSSPLIRSSSSGVDFGLATLDLDLKVRALGRRHNLGACFFSRDLHMLPRHWKRRFWLQSLIFHGRGHVYMLVLFSRDLQTSHSCRREGHDLECWSTRSRVRLCACSHHLGSLHLFFSFRREGLDLEGFSRRERNLNLIVGRLGGRLGLKMRG